MNNLKLFIITLMTYTVSMSALTAQNPSSPAELLTKITGEAKETGDEVKAISTSIFDMLNPTIEETYNLSAVSYTHLTLPTILRV